MNSKPDHFAIPELCNTSAIALLVLFSQLVVVVLVLSGDHLSWLRFGLTSLFVQWVALASAGILCALRPIVLKLSLGAGVSAIFSVVLGVTAVVGLVAEVVVVQDGNLLSRLVGQLLIAGIITGLVLRYFYVQQKLRQQEQAELHARIQALQSRIRPHFLFNSMNIIASLIETDPRTAEDVVEDLSELFRASLNEMGNQVDLADELDLCERYIRIEALRLGDRLDMRWDVEDAPAKVQIPMLTLQPLLENAIYHGVQPLPEGGTINLKVRYIEDKVEICVENPIPDAIYRRESQGNKMALQNIRSRLAVLYGPQAKLETEEKEGLFVTLLQFPRELADAV